MGELRVTVARVKTEKSKRRPGKSAHVAVDKIALREEKCR